MADQKPPRPVGGERETLVALQQYQRDSIVRKVTGVSDADARRELVASGTTLLWLMKHLTYAETIWIVHRFAGDDSIALDNTVQAGDTLAGAIDAYRATWKRVDAIVAAAPDLDVMCAQTGTESAVSLRWVLMHLLEETARHAGHADILRELIDEHTGR
jgi:hypothetical protein